MPQSHSKSRLDPQDLFEFLSTQEEYPVSGVGLARRARQQGASRELVKFFEAIPITFHNESEIVAHAAKPSEPPVGTQLDLGPTEIPLEEVNQKQAVLEISDVQPKK
jgi:hypothetical protein